MKPFLTPENHFENRTSIALTFLQHLRQCHKCMMRLWYKMAPFLMLAPKQRSILNLLFRFCNLYDVPQVDAGGDQQSRAIRASWDLGISQLSAILRNIFNKIYQRTGRASFKKYLQQNISQDQSSELHCDIFLKYELEKRVRQFYLLLAMIKPLPSELVITKHKCPCL